MRSDTPIRLVLGAAAVLAVAPPAPAQRPAVAAHAPRAAERRPPMTAADHIRAALTAMGGEDVLRALHSTRIETIEHTFLLEQSERFEGPWIPMYRRVRELRDYDAGRVRTTSSMLFGQVEDWTPPQTVVVADGVATMGSGERVGPAQPTAVADAEARLALSPERVLLLALAAPDLRLLDDTMVQGVPHHAVAFGWNGGRVRIFLNAGTALPTEIETTRAYSDNYFWDVWGDVIHQTFFSYWTLVPGGIRYPRQADVRWHGFPYRTTTVTAITLNAPAPADSFAIPDDARAAFAAMAGRVRGPKDIEPGEAWGGLRRLGEPESLADGVVIVPGGYYTLLVRQPDGIVIIEAPFSSEYTRKMLAEAGRRFPGQRVKAVVTTGDAWTYMGGVREYAARGIPIYALDLNRTVLETLIRQPHTLDPDSLARAPRAPSFRWVSGRTVVGAGPNRIEILPFRSEGGERMMAVQLPERRLLWSSDLIQRMPDGSFFMPQYISEVVDLVQREGLAVGTVAGMHLAPMPWQEALEAVERRLRATPTAR